MLSKFRKKKYSNLETTTYLSRGNCGFVSLAKRKSSKKEYVIKKDVDGETPEGQGAATGAGVYGV